MNKEALHNIFEKIKEYKKIAIHTHIRPDGDAMGTACGLKDIIVTTWPDKEVNVVGETSEFTSFIGLPDETPDEFFEGALSILVDTSAKDRIFDQRFAKSDFVIKIDHHIFVEVFGDIDYVDTSRPAAALIILDLFLLHEAELSISPVGLKALFTGILTDTGRFKYDGVDGDTFRNVAKLFDLGLKTRPIYEYLDERSEELTRFRGYLLQNYQKTEHGVVFFKILPALLEQFNVSLDEATSLVNDLGVFKDCPVWILFAEYEGNVVRARMRSKGPSINVLANKYNGGGHRLACGANLGTWDKTDDLLADADELVRLYKEE